MQRLLDMGGQSGAGLLVLILHGLQAKERLSVARCCRFLHQVVTKPAAWKHCPDLETDYVGPNTSVCTRHMPISSTTMLFNPKRKPEWMATFHAFASSVCLRALAFDHSTMGSMVYDEFVQVYSHPSLLHLERLAVLGCNEKTGSALSVMPRLNTLSVFFPMKPTVMQSLRACPSLTSLSFVEGKSWFDDEYDSCLSVVATFPHLQRLRVTNPRVTDILSFCRSIAHNRSFTHLTVRELSLERNRAEDLPDVRDFGPLSFVSIHGGCSATSDLLEALQHASSLRRIVLHEWYPFASIEMLLRANKHLCVTIHPSTAVAPVPFGSDEDVQLENLRRNFPNRFDMTSTGS